MAAHVSHRPELCYLNKSLTAICLSLHPFLMLSFTVCQKNPVLSTAMLPFRPKIKLTLCLSIHLLNTVPVPATTPLLTPYSPCQ